MVLPRLGIGALALVSAIASCSSPKPSPATTDGGYGSDKAIAAFDCGMIQGPLSTNRFYEDNPTYTDPVDDSASWTISTPAAQGMDSSRLERASTTLADLPYTRSFLVIRRGALVFERYYHGSAKNQSNNVHSASKSIWGAAIGIAIDQGRIPGIDTTIASILPSRYVTVMNPQTRTITVRDLLTMTSGSRWDEDETETQIQRTPDWITATLKLPRAARPGTQFNYSTGDTHLSSAVLTSATGTTACQFTHQYLLAPLGIVAEHWGRDPQGYFSGGYNFYLTPRELAKFGLLYLQDGRWHGTQIVPAAWVQASMTNQVDAGAPYSYGYDFWLRDIAGHHVAMAWGPAVRWSTSSRI
ncbi:6-aminohexanoate-dimer hydrolase [Phytohabitans flavus]|uniref:6-aminohexanoate-dimer hydrolase n=1 Tax=Phytohabitans flavus TaxID=1076124 RepID=A0A6F8XN28_9ACTN|nr:6-aminohexanoate-dimer hydrolase [Phytohabitans flavus]